MTVAERGAKAAARRTKVMRQTLAPVWDDPAFEYALGGEEAAVLELRVYDEDVIGFEDELLASLDVDARAVADELASSGRASLLRELPVDPAASRQKAIRLTLEFRLAHSPVSSEDLEGRLQFIDMDLCWDPCQLEVKVDYPIGITVFEVAVSVKRLILPVRVALEWKACPADDVPTLDNLRLFPEHFLRNLDRQQTADRAGFLQELSKYYKAFPNMNRVWLCMTAKPLIRLDVQCTAGDVESLLLKLGILDVDTFAADTTYNLFPRQKPHLCKRCFLNLLYRLLGAH